MNTWIHISNPFEAVTKESRRKMLILITDHTSRLQNGVAVAVINTLYTRTAPVKLDFSNKYSTWSVANGQWKAETNRVNAGLKDLSGTKIENWDIRIQMIFTQGSADYQALLPRRRVPFQEGTMDERIAAVHTLGEALDAYPGEASLVTLKGEVDAFYTDLLGKRNVQQQREQAVKNASDVLEAARVVCADMMFRNLGMLIDTYPTEPGMITNYYQMDLMRDQPDNSVEYDGVLGQGETRAAVSTGITQTSSILIRNTGLTALEVDLQANPNVIGPTALILQPGEDHVVHEGDIPPLSAYYLNIRNQSVTQQGSYHVVVS
jgi:hypothetical protein